MKKTLLLTKEYFPFFGGIATYCYSLFKYFDKKDYLVICDHPQVKTEDNIINLALENKYIWPSWFFAFWQIKKIIQEQKIEIIFTPNILPLGSIAYFLNKFLHIPYIISLHGLDLNLALEAKPKLTYKILQQAQTILVNSQTTAKILDVFPELKNKIIVLYPSLNLDFAKFEPAKLDKLKNHWQISPETTVFLSVGRLVSRKGHSSAISALAASAATDFRYFIVGRGPEKENLLKLIKKYELTDKIQILEDVAYADLIYYYKLANIFLLPQQSLSVDTEGFGIVFLEAAAAGLSIIAGNNGGVLEILSDQKNALLVNSQSELETAIQKLMIDKNLQTYLAQNALARSKEFLSAQAQSEKLKHLLSI